MTIGVAGAAISAYNVVVDGNVKAQVQTKEELGADYVDMYVKNLSSSKESHLLEKVKNYLMDQKLDNSFYPFVINAKNHITSWINETVENIVPITLSVLAFSTPKLVEKYKAGQIKPMLNNFFMNIGNLLKKTGTFIKDHNFLPKIFKIVKKIPKTLKAQSAEALIAGGAAGLLLFEAGRIFAYDALGIGKTKEY